MNLHPPEVLDEPSKTNEALSSIVEAKGNQVLRAEPSVLWLMTRFNYSREDALALLGVE
jgi:hypothetical protein